MESPFIYINTGTVTQLSQRTKDSFGTEIAAKKLETGNHGPLYRIDGPEFVLIETVY